MKFSHFSGIIVGRDPLSPFEVNRAYNTTQFSNFHLKESSKRKPVLGLVWRVQIRETVTLGLLLPKPKLCIRVRPNPNDKV